MPLGLAGVHLGQDDSPPALARELLGPAALVGLSTHSAADVVGANAADVDYLGFGPLHATQTKGYDRGLGFHAAWIAANGSELPLFPIGGIDPFNVGELAPIGRAAVCSAILDAEDPGQVAGEMRDALAPFTLG
jgi:thiamine-phosphate pyrophosphorylase